MGGWDTQIFDCSKNIVMFAWSLCVPCGCVCMQAINAKLSDSDKNAPIIAALLLCCLGDIGGILNRYRLRTQLNIEDSIVADIVFWCFIPCCAVTQEYIEVMKQKGGGEKVLIWEALKD